jgi:hypothetical protein
MRTRPSYVGVLLASAALLFALAGSASAHRLAAPTISSFAPTQALHGQKVTLYGSGFTGATGVQFGGIDAQYSVVSDTHITAIVPGEVAAGKWNISVSTPDGNASSSTMFDVLPAGAVILKKAGLEPRITRVTPMRGRAGTHITITGTHLGGAMWVKLGGLKIPYTVPSATRIQAVVSTRAHSGKLTLLTNYGLATSPARFTVIPSGVLGASH